MQILWLIPALAGLYLGFSVLPSALCLRLVLGRSDKPPLCQVGPDNPRYDDWVRAKEELAGADWQQVSVTAPDGVKLCGAFLDRGCPRTALCLHGFLGSAMNNFALQGSFLLKEGFNLLFVDQRAHGASGGSSSALGLLEQQDLLEWLRWLASRSGGRQVLVCGISMGAATAAFASDRMDPLQVRGMVLDCPYLSPEGQIIRGCRERHVPWALMRISLLWIARLRLGVDLRQSCGDSLERTRIPALFLHGEEDATVSLGEGKAAFDRCASEKEWLQVPGAGHTLAFLLGGEQAEEALRRLIRRGFDPGGRDELSR